jgi:apolipoprotein N-acyltransferase
MGRRRMFLYCVLSSLLLSLGWVNWFSGLILFFGFIPLLFVEHYLFINRSTYKPHLVFRYATITFILWNGLSVYWIYHATIIGAVATILINSFLMSFTFWLFHVTHRQFGTRVGYISFIIFWIAFEHFFLNTELTFPWLNLGNGLAKDIRFIQWYEYTGVQGGTAWILIINVLLFLYLKDLKNQAERSIQIWRTGFLLFIVFLPIVFSIYRFHTYEEKTDPQSIVILQPNIDPYTEKFENLLNEEQLNILLGLADSLTDSETDYIVGPETAISDNIWENFINNNHSINRIRSFIEPFPNAKFVTGAISFRKYETGETLSPTARKFNDTTAFYEVFNAAMLIDHTPHVQFYHKSMLVNGVEKIPYPKVFGFMERFIFDLGGMSGSLGTQSQRTTLNDPDNGIKVGTAICYESDFGEFYSGFVRNGANLMMVITNDGWWGNTAGYKRHLAYSSLRAIETRRSIARSANTGISCFINQKGEIIQSADWWQMDVIKSILHLNNKQTFYVRYGDYIGRISDFLTVILILYTLVNILIKKRR